MTLPSDQNRRGLLSSYLSQRPTAPLSTDATPFLLEESPIRPEDAPTLADSSVLPVPPQSRQKLRQMLTRLLALALVVTLAGSLYFIWSPASIATTVPPITQQNFGSSTGATRGTTNSDATNHNTASGGSIQVYIVGAVKHPGIYILAANARVYQLLQAAGGPLPNANLVALNLAARLNDGQEVYVTMRGEKPPSYTGGVPAPGSSSDTTDSLVNINTASAQDLQQKLHISSTTALEIINYRTQHGLFTSVDQLAAAISKTTYDKIKGLVTV